MHASFHADVELTESVKGDRTLRKRPSTSKEGEGDYSHWKLVNYASPEFSPYNYERKQIMWQMPELLGEVMLTSPRTLAMPIKGKSNVSATLRLPLSVINDIYKQGCINRGSRVRYA